MYIYHNLEPISKALKLLRSRSNVTALPFATLLRKQILVNVRQNTSICNCN